MNQEELEKRLAEVTQELETALEASRASKGGE